MQGILVSDVLGIKEALGSVEGWKWLFVIPVFLAAFQFCMLWLVPESPKWLCLQGRVDEARRMRSPLYLSKNIQMTFYLSLLLFFLFF